MPKPIKFRGRVQDNGEPTKALLSNFLNAVRTFAGREVVNETTDALRSLSANNHYWGFVVPPVQALFTDCGWPLSKDDTHDWLKREFLGVHVIEIPSSDLRASRTREVVGTTRTDAWTFQDYVMAIQSHPPFVEAGLFIPEPEGKLRGRTIHEPGGTKITFAAESRAQNMADEYLESEAAHVHPDEPESVQAHLLDISSHFEPTGTRL